MTAAFACPACGYAQHPDNARCLRCHEHLSAADEGPVIPSLSKEARRALAIGFALALVLWLIPWTNILFQPLITIVHELGHATTAWLFGYPAIPAFDFSEGGGVTSQMDRVPLLMIGPYALMAWAVWRVRRHPPTIVALAGLAGLYTWVAFSDWHHVAIVAMGHGTELIMAMVFLYRAMSGTTLLQADERPAYAMCGFLIWLHDVAFGWKLAFDADTQAWYDEGKSYADNDFTVLSTDYLGSPVHAIAVTFLTIAVVCVCVPRLFYRYEGAIAAWRMRAVVPSGGS